MKRLLVALLMVASATVSAQDPFSIASVALSIGQWITKNSTRVYYVKVKSEGLTEDEARRNGFSFAIDQAVGTVIVSERESSKRDLIRADVINYSSGYVEDFKVLDRQVVGRTHVVTMDVWVSHSKIAERALALGESSGSTMNQQKLTSDWEREKAKLVTDAERSRQAGRLFTSILNDYHRMAYNVEVVSMKVAETSYKRPYYGLTTSQSFIVSTKIKGNDKYFDALKEAIKTTNEEGYHNEKWTVRLGGLFGSARGGWKDKSIQESFINAFDPRNTQVMVKFIGATNPRAACYDLSDKHFEGSLGYDKKPNGWDERVYNIPSSFNYETNFILPRREDQSEDQFIQWVQSVKGVEIEFVNPSKCRVRG
jgi:hypothetical protein